jgi:hypothetical protein
VEGIAPGVSPPALTVRGGRVKLIALDPPQTSGQSGALGYGKAIGKRISRNAMEGKMQEPKIEMEIVGGLPPSLEELKIAEIARLQLLIELLKEDLKEPVK